MILKLNALQVAKTQVGEHEDPLGSNWGEPVKSYLQSVGINFPASWCAAFVYWCFKKGAEMEGSGKNNLPKTAGVMKMWEKTPPENRVTVPEPGDIFIMDFGKGLGHTGIVEQVDETFIYTVEGNTNDTGGREGIEVSRRQRSRNKIKGYIRY
jgi:hypothetical protein